MGKKRKKAGASPGGGTKNDQVSKLKTAVGAKGVKDAESIVASYPADVVRLAFKLLPARKVELSEYDKSMIAALGMSEADYLKAKANRKAT